MPPQREREQDDLEALIQRCCDQALSANEQQQLAERLSRDPAAQQVYLEWLRLHGEIAWSESPGVPFAANELQRFSLAEQSFADDSNQTAERNQDTSPVQAKLSATARHGMTLETVRSHPWRFAAAVATLTTLVWIAFFFIIRSGKEPDARLKAEGSHSWPAAFVAQVVGLSKDGMWADVESGPGIGSLLTPGRALDLLAGHAEIAFRNGSTVTLQSPALFKVNSSQSSELVRGRAVVHASEGFVVATPAATIVDLGTEFGVAVNGRKETRVAVFSGSVLVTSTDGTLIRYVAAGDSLRVGSMGTLVSAADNDESEKFAQENVDQERKSARDGMLQLNVVTKDGDFRVDLTSRGTADWAYWDAGRLEKADRKEFPILTLGELKLIGSPTPSDFGRRYQGLYRWADGTNQVTSPAEAYGMVQAHPGSVGEGFHVISPADSVPRLLTLFVGTYSATGTLTARLSDNSAPALLDSQSADGIHIYSIQYKASKPAQTLTLQWTMSANRSPSANILIQAAALAPAIPGERDVGSRRLGTVDSGLD